ncbi:hypothetical protein AOQ84DRAFT_226676, partial [Glonium stellatum]
MGLGGLIEPLVVVTLLFGGTWINRNRSYRLSRRPRQPHNRVTSPSVLESGLSSPSLQSDSSSSPSSSSSSPTSSSYSYSSDDGYEVPTRISPSRLPTQGGMRWRRREIELLGWRREVATPDTRVFRGRLLSRLLRRFPFLVEAWYWALIYWVYQLGRAFTAVTLVEGTVHVARRHALQLIHLEQSLHLFHELAVQRWFLAHPTLLHWTNRLYS